MTTSIAAERHFGRWWLRIAVLLVLALIASAVFKRSAPPPPPPRLALDPTLRALPLYFYPAKDSTRSPRAVIFFFGNDVGFWRPQQRLAWALSDKQFAVVGYDLRELLRSLPADSAAAHAQFVSSILKIIAAARHEFHGDSLPLIIAGHSLGSEIALWTAAYARPPGVVGVLALSPGTRGHLKISLGDLAMFDDDSGPGSFALADVVAAIPTQQRVAIIRGSNDHRGLAGDSALLASGGGHTQKFVVPLAGHSFKRIMFLTPLVTKALDWMLQH